MHMKQIL